MQIANKHGLPGASFFAGGIRHAVQEYNPLGAQTQSTTLSIAAIALVVPAAFHNLGAGLVTAELEQRLSLAIALVRRHGLQLLQQARVLPLREWSSSPAARGVSA